MVDHSAVEIVHFMDVIKTFEIINHVAVQVLHQDSTNLMTRDLIQDVTFVKDL